MKLVKVLAFIIPMFTYTEYNVIISINIKPNFTNRFINIYKKYANDIFKNQNCLNISIYQHQEEKEKIIVNQTWNNEKNFIINLCSMQSLFMINQAQQQILKYQPISLEKINGTINRKNKINKSATISTFYIKRKVAKTAYSYLENLMHEMSNKEGCISYNIYRDTNNKNKFVVVETWQNHELQISALKNKNFIKTISNLTKISIEKPKINCTYKIY